MTSATEDYCEHCDLALSMCVHGRPAPVEPPTPPRAARKSTPTAARSAASTSRAKAGLTVRHTGQAARTPQRDFRAPILAVLLEHDGRHEVDPLLVEVERRMQPVLRSGDYDAVNGGEIRWRYAARWERKAMVDEGLLKSPSEPGIWELTTRGREAAGE